ncbi:MAG: hypothetical protein NWF11_01780 [Candidatus Bathyarchaeota archaeon]|nr:hypothetical protein [Candidatus Bathyarchaeota archaeon]
MGKTQICQTRAADRKLSFRKLMTIWTTSLLGAVILMMLFTPELAEVFLQFSSSLSIMEGVIIFFFVSPIVTIWGIGIVVSAYKYRMLCAVPTATFVSSFLLSSLFNFPLSTLFTFVTLIIMVYTLLQNRLKQPLNETLSQSQT